VVVAAAEHQVVRASVDESRILAQWDGAYALCQRRCRLTGGNLRLWLR